MRPHRLAAAVLAAFLAAAPLLAGDRADYAKDVDFALSELKKVCGHFFKEYGRARVIGESPTAGMSSSKKTIELPSGLFALYVSVDSNMNRFNGGKGIEGIGIPPDEVVECDARDLTEGRDTMIRRAEEILAEAGK